MYAEMTNTEFLQNIRQKIADPKYHDLLHLRNGMRKHPSFIGKIPAKFAEEHAILLIKLMYIDHYRTKRRSPQYTTLVESLWQVLISRANATGRSRILAELMKRIEDDGQRNITFLNKLLKMILNKGVSNINIPFLSYSLSRVVPVHIAAGYGNAVTVKLLQQKNANFHARTTEYRAINRRSTRGDQEGHTPLFYAAIFANVPALNRILGFNFTGVDVNAVDNMGRTALYSVLEVIERLSIGRRGISPQKLRKFDKVVQSLIIFGANPLKKVHRNYSRRGHAVTVHEMITGDRQRHIPAKIRNTIVRTWKVVSGQRPN